MTFGVCSEGTGRFTRLPIRRDFSIAFPAQKSKATLRRAVASTLARHKSAKAVAATPQSPWLE
jgi:hypothetical protein